MHLNEIENPINRVIFFNQDIGVIRYVGPIHGIGNDSEIWFGIEWKDPSRGKHDGLYKGNRYFETKHPTGGSFVKQNKVDFGVDIWKAIEEKYFEEESGLSTATEDKDQDHLLYNNLDAKAKCLKLKCISLAQSKISRIETLSKINEHFTQLKEIDLEENLFYSWSQIFDILKELKQLKILNVSNNILPIDENILNNDIVFENISSLILNKMNYNWNDIYQVLNHFTKLTELKVCFNPINEINKMNESLIDNLKVLDLESSLIGDWKNFNKFGELKQLETLYANDIRLNEIYFDDCDHTSKTNLFPSLQCLSINDNRINDWKSINELNKLKSMVELRFKMNPLNHSDQNENIRQFIIAKIENLKILNRTNVERKERKGAEIDYLKKFAKIWLDLEAKKDLPETQNELNLFYQQHPSYQNLIKRYGAAEKSEAEIKPDILKSSLISLNILNEQTGQNVVRKIPSTTEIKRLKVIICNLFRSSGFETESLRLFYKTIKKPGSEYELDNDYRMLSFYSLENNDTIIAKSI